MVNQGQKANQTGRQFENKVKQLVSEYGFEPTQKKYESKYSTRSKTDVYLPEIDTVIECKYQGVSGTADQKGITEIANAIYTLNARRYIYVVGGPHWDTDRGNKMYSFCKQFVDDQRDLNQLEEILVLKYSEFKDWISKYQK